MKRENSISSHMDKAHSFPFWLRRRHSYLTHSIKNILIKEIFYRFEEISEIWQIRKHKRKIGSHFKKKSIVQGSTDQPTRQYDSPSRFHLLPKLRLSRTSKGKSRTLAVNRKIWFSDWLVCSLT